MAQTPGLGSGKDLESFHKLPRSPAGSFMFRASVEKKARFHYLLSAFLPNVFWEWIGNYLGHRLGPRHAFQYYDHPSINNGVYKLGDDSLIGGQPDPKGEVRISIAGDWGTGTDEAYEVAQRMQEFNPHYTIHLGDVYYVGDEIEVKENCLGVRDPHYSFIPCNWPLGSVGSFALNGNHEMYALGRAYFDLFLPELGIRPAPGAHPSGQKASFFCLQNDYWRIIGLDTGYNSIGIPLLEYIFSPSCKLRDELLSWIREQVNPKGSKRGTILLSHHQYCSMFQEWYTEPAKQLASLVDSPVLWFWGHEHRMAVYGKFSTKGGIEAYGRCVGHGGMPVDINSPVKHPECPAVLYDNRRYPSDEKIQVGYNGFLNLTFRGNQLTVDYRDVRNIQLLTEEWKVEGGVLKGKGIQLLSENSEVRREPSLRRAIGKVD